MTGGSVWYNLLFPQSTRTAESQIRLTLPVTKKELHFSQMYFGEQNLPLWWWGPSHDTVPLPAGALCTSHPHLPSPDEQKWRRVNKKTSHWWLQHYFRRCMKPDLTMFQNLSKATTKPEHTPLRPLNVLMWTLTLILSSTHRYSSPRGLPLHAAETRQKQTGQSNMEGIHIFEMYAVRKLDMFTPRLSVDVLMI